ncbi:MAG: hypothetical protein OWR62_16590 [Sulfobacillus thermotolerans]|nr:hypothetical protein [Sulfobacillus thermotolerans]
MVDVYCYGPPTPMTVPQVAEALRHARIGEEIRVFTDNPAVLNEMRAVAHLSGNKLARVHTKTAVTIDMKEQPDHIYVASDAPPEASGQYWVVIFHVMPHNRFASR